MAAFPADAWWGMRMVMGMMVHELQDMVADLGAATHSYIWRARLYHRLLRLVRWAKNRRAAASGGEWQHGGDAGGQRHSADAGAAAAAGIATEQP